MLYIVMAGAGQPVAVLGEDAAVMSAIEALPEGQYVESRHDWRDKGFDHVARIARVLSRNTGVEYTAIDSGPNVLPRYDIIETPRVGELVSYSFNGDSYPDGEIKKVSASLRVIETSTGAKYYRRRQTGTWIKQGGTWALIRGHVNERNPEF